MKDKYKKSFISLIVLILCAIITSCNQSSDLTQISAVEEPTPSKTVRPSATLTVTPTVMVTPSPSSTPDSTLTILVKYENTETPWPTSEETLMPENRDQYLSDLLNTNGGCELPCFWGVSPGDDLTDFYTLLEPIGAKNTPYREELSFSDRFYVINPIHLYGGSNIYEPDAVYDKGFAEIDISVYSQDGIVEIINAEFQDYSAIPLSKMPTLDKLEAYEMRTMLEQIGVPDRILLYMSYISQTAYTLYFYYGDMGIFLSFDGVAWLTNPIFLYPSIMDNPNGKIYGIQMIIMKPEDFKYVDELVQEFPLSEEYLKSIEDLGYTVEEAYQALIDPNPMKAYLKISHTHWEQERIPELAEFNELKLDIEFDHIFDVSFSPDNQQMVVSDDEKSIYILNRTENDEWVETVHLEKPGIWWPIWSPVDSLIAFSFPGYLEIWDANTQSIHATGDVGAKKPPKLVWSPDGEIIAVPNLMNNVESHENSVEFYNSQSMENIFAIKTAPQMRDTYNLSWNYDINDPVLVVASRLEYFYFYKDGNFVRYPLTINPSAGSISSFWVQDDKFILIINDTQRPIDDRSIRIAFYDGMDLLSEVVLSPPPINKERAILASDYDPNRRLLAIYTKDGVFTIYKVTDNEIIFVEEINFPLNKNYACMKFSPMNDGVYLYNTEKIYFISFVE